MGTVSWYQTCLAFVSMGTALKDPLLAASRTCSYPHAHMQDGDGCISVPAYTAFLTARSAMHGLVGAFAVCSPCVCVARQQQQLAPTLRRVPVLSLNFHIFARPARQPAARFRLQFMSESDKQSVGGRDVCKANQCCCYCDGLAGWGRQLLGW